MLQECNHENMILHIYKKTYFYMHMAIRGIFFFAFKYSHIALAILKIFQIELKSLSHNSLKINFIIVIFIVQIYFNRIFLIFFKRTNSFIFEFHTFINFYFLLF